MPFCQALDTRPIQMIVVVVRDEHEVDRRQRVKRHCWRNDASRPGKLYR
jgi:hypothetical protein